MSRRVLVRFGRGAGVGRSATPRRNPEATRAIRRGSPAAAAAARQRLVGATAFFELVRIVRVGPVVVGSPLYHYCRRPRRWGSGRSHRCCPAAVAVPHASAFCTTARRRRAGSYSRLYRRRRRPCKPRRALGAASDKLGIWVLNTRVEALAGRKCTTSSSGLVVAGARGAETSERLLRFGRAASRHWQAVRGEAGASLWAGKAIICNVGGITVSPSETSPTTEAERCSG